MKDEDTGVRPTQGRGNRLFAKKPFIKGDIICCYVREVLDATEFSRRDEVRKLSRKIGHQSYDMNVYGTFLSVDSERFLNNGRFCNHSCSPNAGYFKTYVPDDNLIDMFYPELVLMAEKDINVGEEITADYGKSYNLGNKCRCGHPRCVGFETEWGVDKEKKKAVKKREARRVAREKAEAEMKEKEVAMEKKTTDVQKRKHGSNVTGSNKKGKNK